MPKRCLGQIDDYFYYEAVDCGPWPSLIQTMSECLIPSSENPDCSLAVCHDPCQAGDTAIAINGTPIMLKGLITCRDKPYLPEASLRKGGAKKCGLNPKVTLMATNINAIPDGYISYADPRDPEDSIIAKIFTWSEGTGAVLSVGIQVTKAAAIQLKNSQTPIDPAFYDPAPGKWGDRHYHYVTHWKSQRAYHVVAGKLG